MYGLTSYGSTIYGGGAPGNVLVDVVQPLEEITSVDTILKMGVKINTIQGVGVTDTIVKDGYIVREDSCGVDDDIELLSGKVFEEICTTTDGIIKDGIRIIDEVIIGADLIEKMGIIEFTNDIMEMTDAFTSTLVINLILPIEELLASDSFGPTIITRICDEVSDCSESIIKSIDRVVDIEMMSVVDVVEKTGVQLFVDVVTVGDSIVKDIVRWVTESVNMEDSSSIVKIFSRILSDTIHIDDIVSTIKRGIGKMYSQLRRVA